MSDTMSNQDALALAIALVTERCAATDTASPEGHEARLALTALEAMLAASQPKDAGRFFSWYETATEKAKASEVGRFLADGPPSQEWTVDHTGGGCLAWSAALPNGGYAWITCEDGATVPETMADAVYCGVYDNDGEEIVCREFPSTVEAVIYLQKEFGL